MLLFCIVGWQAHTYVNRNKNINYLLIVKFLLYCFAWLNPFFTVKSSLLFLSFCLHCSFCNNFTKYIHTFIKIIWFYCVFLYLLLTSLLDLNVAFNYVLLFYLILTIFFSIWCFIYLYQLIFVVLYKTKLNTASTPCGLQKIQCVKMKYNVCLY